MRLHRLYTDDEFSLGLATLLNLRINRDRLTIVIYSLFKANNAMISLSISQVMTSYFVENWRLYYLQLETQV